MSSDPHPGKTARASSSPVREKDERGFFQKLVEFLHPGPDSKDELMEALADAEDNQVINAESRVMLEGVLRMAEMTAGDVVVPASRMDMLDISASTDELMQTVIDTGRSRFPVFEGERDQIIGIMMAKDLLKLQRAPELNLRALLRPVVYVPESKGLNELLRDFRQNRNHLALVVDEFGHIAGLLTIEDVLETIVGEIEDEFDSGHDAGDIFTLADGSYRIAGDTALERVNEAFDVHLPLQEFETLAGLVSHELGHVPRRNEIVSLHGLNLRVMHTKGGVVKWFKVTLEQAA